MNKFKCIIADDNSVERDTLEFFLKKIDKIEIVAVCKSGLEAYQIILNQKIDIVFSDIDMPDLSGIELLKSLKNPPIFIFITSYADYAVDSFNLDVIDFMVKPATFERVLKASNKAFEYLEIKKMINKEVNLKDEYFFIKDTNGLTKLNYEEVLNVESYGDFSKVYTSNTKSHLVLANLKSIEKQLPDHTFIRTHRQHLVNINHIAAIRSGDIILSNDIAIPLSSTFKQNLEAILSHKIITRIS